MTMTSSRPYIVRALYDWIVDNGLTPYLLVDSSWPGLDVPPQIAGDEQIVLNVSPMAVRELSLDNEYISFSARFSGKSFTVFVPVGGVLAIYAKENGQGMVFDAEQPPESDDADALAVVSEAEPEVEKPGLKGVSSDSSASGGDDKPPKKPGGRPSLKVVK